MKRTELESKGWTFITTSGGAIKGTLIINGEARASIKPCLTMKTAIKRASRVPVF